MIQHRKTKFSGLKFLRKVKPFLENADVMESLGFYDSRLLLAVYEFNNFICICLIEDQSGLKQSIWVGGERRYQISESVVGRAWPKLTKINYTNCGS
jgi:hypothetical protein